MKTEKAKLKIAAGGFLMAEYSQEDERLKYTVVPGGGRLPYPSKAYHQGVRITTISGWPVCGLNAPDVAA